ncbi:MAG: alpha/beta hydrolase [Actinobacteria bacterium]|nr:alpha/beta hydrolase [Actinomycetota bacterium]
MISELERLDQHRRQVRTASGPASYMDTGGPGRPVLFVHGVGTSSYLWRNVIAELDGQRRCIALDLPLHGHTAAGPGQDFSLPGLARFVEDGCAALQLPEVDLVANDTGGAVSQVFAARYPGRLHTLALTNCEAHTNMPPPALRAGDLLMRTGLPLWRLAGRLFGDPVRGRQRFFGSGYQDVSHLPLAVSRAMLDPVLGTPARARQFQRLMVALRRRDLLAAEPALRRLAVPTAIVWGTGDRFFGRKWAYWLRDTIPGATAVIEIEDGRLFFPDERAAELAAALRRHWDAHR